MIKNSPPIGIASYQKLATIPIKALDDPFICINYDTTNCLVIPKMNDMYDAYPLGLLLRRNAFNKFEDAQKNLQLFEPNLKIIICYGYRSLDIQKKLFDEIFQKFVKQNPSMAQGKLMQKAHEFIAVPDIAGHPTGGAIDVTLMHKDGTFVDMGCEIYDFESDLCPTFSKNISKEAKYNRQLLRTCMTQVGFAPFDGEYWHFSYGDKEWAYLTKQPYAVYEQLTLEEVIQKIN